MEALGERRMCGLKEEKERSVCVCGREGEGGEERVGLDRGGVCVWRFQREGLI